MAIPYDPVNDFFSGLGKQPTTPANRPSTDPASSFFGEISQRQGKPQVQPVIQPIVQPQQVKKPPSVQEKFISTVKGFDIKKIGQSIVAGAKDLPGMVKQTAGIILGDWVRTQKAVEKFFTPVPEPIREIIKKAVPGVAPKKAVEKIEPFAAKLREAATQERKITREKYEKTFEPSTGLQGLLEMAAYNLPQMAASTGMTLATAIITKNPALAITVGLSSSYGLGASEVYNEAKSQEVDEGTAQSLAMAGGIVIGALDFLPIGRLLGKVGPVEQIKKSIVKKIASGIVSLGVQSGFEGITEGAQEIVGNALASTYQENRNLLQGVTEAGFVGMLLGALGDVTVSGTVGVLGRRAKQNDVVKDIEKKIEKIMGTPPEKRTPDMEEIVKTITVRNYRPDEAATLVLENNLGETEVGKKVMLAVINADASQYIHIEPSEDKKGLNVSIVNEPSEQKVSEKELPGKPGEKGAPTVVEKKEIPKELEPLAQEARKYKSAEEFLDKKAPLPGYNDEKTILANIEKAKKNIEVYKSRGDAKGISDETSYINKRLEILDKRKQLTDIYDQATRGEYVEGDKVKAITGDGKIIEGTFTVKKAPPVVVGNRTVPSTGETPGIITSDGKFYPAGDLPGMVKEIVGKIPSTRGAKTEFKVGDKIDTQGGSNMEGVVTIREIEGNTIKFTDSKGTDFAGMQRSDLRNLVNGGSWKRVIPTEVQPGGQEITPKDLVQSKTVEEIQQKLQHIFGTYKELEILEKKDFKTGRIAKNPSKWLGVADEYMADIERAANDRDYEETSVLLSAARKELASIPEDQRPVSVQKNPPQVNVEARNDAIDNIKSSLMYDLPGAEQFYNDMLTDIPNLPPFEDLVAEVEKIKQDNLDEVKKEMEALGQSANPDAPENKIIAIANELAKHFKGPGALYKIVGRRRVYQTPEGRLAVGGNAIAAFDNLIFTTDMEGFTKNIKILASKFDKTLTTISDKIKKGDIDGADYETFKQKFAEEIGKRASFRTKRGTVIPSSAQKGKPETTVGSGETPVAPLSEEIKTSPAYTGGSEGSAKGDFAKLENLTDKESKTPEFKRVPFPEIVRIVKNLTGKVPRIKKRMYAGGKAFSGDLDINLKASIFSDPTEAAKILSHELGHITDYLPEGAKRTGNLLGRVASLKGYFKHWLSEFPGGIGQMLTDKEKRQLRKEAEELAKKPVTEEREIVVSEKMPTTEEILDIWRTNTASIDNPELLSYIQKLPDELKKDIVKAAFKSTIPKWVTFTKKIKEKVTVGVIKNAPEDIRRLYKDLLHKEILKRRLIELKTVRQELQALSAVWRPFDRMKSSDNYVKYRDKPSELYADSISVLFSDPVRLRETAPTFYKAYFNYLSQKPEVSEQYYQIQHLLNRGSDEVNKVRIEEIYKGFEEGAQKRKEVFEKQMKKKSIWFRATTQHISKFHPIYHELNKAMKAGKIQIGEKQKVREVLENMAYSRNDVWLDLEKNETEVLEPLKKAGITEKQLGAWFMLERNLGDRLGIANPDGLIGDFNKEVKEYLSKNFTPEQSEAMQTGVKKFHDETFAIAEKMYNEGMIPEKVYKERIEPYKDSYVTYGVVKYIDKNYVTPYLKEMIGTLEKIENPLVTTMYKRASMLQALAVHKAKKEIVTFLKEMVSDEITVSKSVMGIKHQRIYRPAPGKGQVVLQEDGKWISYDVDPYFEKMFKQFDPKDLHTLAHIAGQFNKYFKPIVTTYKLGWAVYNNPLRDVQRTMKNVAAISKIEGIPFDRIAFLKEWAKTIPEAFKFSGGRLTPLAKQALGQHAISTPWVSYDPTAGEDKALYTLYQKYRVFGLDGDPKADKRITQKMLWPIEMVLKALERTGGTFESTTKLAGFKYLSKRMADQGKVGFYTRNYVGTPNYLEGGAMKEIDNSIWVFSNVILQGYRSDAELIRNPQSRGAWFFESFLQSGIWKLLMVIAASGFLGKPLQDAYENMSEYHKSNFLAVPLAQTPSGKTLYWTVPQDETNRLMGAIIWKTGMALQGKLVKPQQVLDIGAGFVPTITPIFSVVGAWFDYMRGINPWDSYYGRNVLDQQTQKIRGTEGVKKMALWSLNEVGLGNFATYDPATRTTEEKFIQFTPLINRMFKVSDYGITEREVEGEKKEEKQRAVQNKKESDLVKKYAEELRKEGGDPETFKERFAEELYPEGVETTEEQANLNRVEKDFDQELLRREKDTRVNTIIRLKLNTSKINALRGFAEDMAPEAFEDLLNKLYDAKVISKDVFNAVIE